MNSCLNGWGWRVIWGWGAHLVVLVIFTLGWEAWWRGVWVVRAWRTIWNRSSLLLLGLQFCFFLCLRWGRGRWTALLSGWLSLLSFCSWFLWTSWLISSFLSASPSIPSELLAVITAWISPVFLPWSSSFLFQFDSPLAEAWTGGGWRIFRKWRSSSPSFILFLNSFFSSVLFFFFYPLFSPVCLFFLLLLSP